jgi:hypothetical protein
MKPALVVLLFVMLAGSKPTDPASAEKAVARFKGTWKGKSTCVGDRPACKDETVVYRFVPFVGSTWQLRLLADKIIEGKRVPMGALLFAYDDTTRGLRCDFKRGTTHGVWMFIVEGDSLKGELIVLPDGEKARDVRARRIDDAHVPPAPALKAYDE